MRKLSLRLDERVQEFCELHVRCTVSDIVGNSLTKLRKGADNEENLIAVINSDIECDRHLTSVYLNDSEYLFAERLAHYYKCPLSKIIHFAVYEYIYYLVGGEYFEHLFKAQTESH